MKHTSRWNNPAGSIVLVLGLTFLMDVSSGSAQETAQNDSIVQITADAQGLQQISTADLPRNGTFWVMVPGYGGNLTALPYPCMPPSPYGLPVYSIAGNSFLVDDTSGQVLATGSPLAARANTTMITSALETQATTVLNLIDMVQGTQLQSMGMAMGMDIPSPADSGGSGGGGTNGYYSDSFNFHPDYGTNLWIRFDGISSGNAVGIISNSPAAVKLELQYTTDLTQPWQSAGWFVYGSQLTNWTPFSVPAISSSNLFLRVRSWADDGSGLPIWWQLQYFGYVGANPNALDSANDGWSVWQKFQMGLNPNVFYTPPAPKDLMAQYNSAADTANLTWSPSPGPVTGYTVERTDGLSGNTQDFNVSAGVEHYADTISSDIPDPLFSNGWGVSYRVQAHYAGGNSAWSDNAQVSVNTLQANLIGGPQGSAWLAVSALPPGTAALELIREDQEVAFFDGLNSDYRTNFIIPLSSITNGLYQIPNAWCIMPPDIYGDVASYIWSVATVNSNGTPSFSGLLTSGYIADDYAHAWLMPPFSDGRAQIKQNVIFQLRAATVDLPFSYIAIASDGSSHYTFTNQPDYVYEGFNNVNGLDVFQPFENSSFYRNFVFNPTNLNSNGRITTGVGGNYDFNYVAGWDFTGGLLAVTPPEFQFQTPTTNGAVISALLATNQTQWLATYALDSRSNYLWKIGATNYGGVNGLFNNVRNWYGLPFLSAKIAYAGGNTTLGAGNVTTANGYFYPETAQPQFQLAEYDFWQRSPSPGSSGFSTTNTSDLLIATVGSPTGVNGYAKLAVANSYYSGVYGYLAQYFDKAYKITNGTVTANTTGILSPYGQFFATEPGQVALVTMPDIDTGARGTGTVYCVSLALDANHDGNMDLNFAGTDATSQSSPYTFWADQNFDRQYYDPNDNTNYEEDVQIAYNPGTSDPEPDCNYSNRLSDGYSYRAIPTKRDLEDFTRLWVCGVTTNLLAALPPNSTVTLSWADNWNLWPNDLQASNPTIDLFAAADADGGTGYLTNETIGAQQTNAILSPYIGRLGPHQSIQLNATRFNGWAGNHFIWCGVNNGSGQLNLTIADGNGNVLAQSTQWIQIMDIKQMYERWTVGDNPTIAPTNAPGLVTDGLAAGVPGFQYTAPVDTNTPYILFVHGWNLEPWEKDRFAETAFKRLYWQGYQGRFGEFRWPTDYDFTGKRQIIMTNLDEKDNFDNSEYQAWRSAQGLLNKLDDLNAQYPGHVYLLAHSMGNVAASEALRLGGSSEVVNTYVASQAAVTAHTYDNTVPDYSFYDPPWSFSADTPNIYGNWFAGNGGAAGAIVGFYNTNDYALSRSVWQVDQLLKPDQDVLEGGDRWYYGYSGNISDAAPWNNFYKHDTNSTTVYFNIVTSLNNRYEVMAYAAQPYTTALGATPGILNNITKNVDLTRVSNPIWPSDPTGKNYTEHFWHSAEFEGDYPQQRGYWIELLGSDAFNLK